MSGLFQLNRALSLCGDTWGFFLLLPFFFEVCNIEAGSPRISGLIRKTT